MEVPKSYKNSTTDRVERHRGSKKIWSLSKSDKEFSIHIRERDGKCVRCGYRDCLTNSHFWGRSNKATRFDEENCDTLCIACHQFFEDRKKTDYRDFKIRQLGMDKYIALQKRALSTMKQTTAIINCMMLLNVV